jgi:hypothetical protein
VQGFGCGHNVSQYANSKLNREKISRITNEEEEEMKVTGDNK